MDGWYVSMTVAQLTDCVDVYGRDVYAFCRHLTGSVADGEDLYQETFLTAMEKLEKIEIDQNPRSYLLTIAVHLWKNKKRKYARRRQLINFESAEQRAEDGMEAVDMNNPLPDEAVAAAELKQQVRECVDSLSDKYRIPICMYYISQLSTKEIAAILKLPEGTVKRRLFAGRKQIKERLEAYGYE